MICRHNNFFSYLRKYPGAFIRLLHFSGGRCPISLWAVQLLLTTLFCWAGVVKLFSPRGELTALWPWTAKHPQLVILTGIVDILGGVGLIVPSLLRIKPRLTIYVALGTILLMIIASIFHIARGEANSIFFNVLVAAMAAFIAWGRSRIWPVPVS
jgi:uncharacterized membrane protein YphA (DoxX/SURF4 family)